jgi:tungstate transport system ATP-binding protein
MQASGVLDGFDIADRERIAIVLRGAGVTVSATTILAPLDLVVRTGRPTMLMGPNGSGKTTLLRLIMSLVPPSIGHVIVPAHSDGRERRCAFVFQKPVMLRRTAAANVAFALATAGRDWKPGRVRQLLVEVGLAELATRPARHLSAGEQQRLALARALARDPDVLLLDEPTASLDPAQTKAVEEIVARIADSGVKVVMATHDVGQARRLAGDIVLLVGGRIAEQAPAAEFFERPRTEEARRFVAGELVV